MIILLLALIGGAAVFDKEVSHVPLAIAVVLLAAISWRDDRGGVSAFKRLSLHLLAACIGSLCFSPDQMVFGGVLPFWLDRILLIVGWTWFINLYNFMDGIDGITGVETISLAVGLCTTMTMAGIDDPFASFLNLVLTGICLGFLAHNWHPAKIFMGDIGSVPLGYIVGFALISLAVKGHLAAAVILPLYYLADSGITIVKRALKGEKIWQAHRQHFYQKAAFGVERHDKVVIAIAVANSALIAASVVSLAHPLAGLISGIVIVAILLQNMHKMAS